MFWELYLIALPVFFIIDMLWLGVVAKKFYRKEIGHLMREDVRWLPAFIFYFLFILGLVYFVILPAVLIESLEKALFAGAFFGFIAYSTYDLTNLAVLKGWSFKLTIIDILWGSFLGMAVSGITYFIATNILM